MSTKPTAVVATRKSQRSRVPKTSDDDDDNDLAEQTNKRRRTNPKEEPEDDDESSTGSSTITYEWVGPETKIVDQTRYYDAIKLCTDEAFVVHRGDAVRLWCADNDDEGWVCRIESIFSKPDVEEPRFRGRWFYRGPELQALVSKCRHANEQATLQKLLKRLKQDDVVLSNLQEENDISTIRNVCKISYEEPNSTTNETAGGDEKDYVCRFRLDWSRHSFSVHEIDIGRDGGVGTSVSGTDDDEDDEDDSSVEARYNHVIQEGEGSTLRGDIEVGDRFQVFVGPFIPNQKVRSRNPKLVWKPGCIDAADYDTFTKDLATVHSKYLRDHNLTVDEPYTPLTSERAEQLMKELHGEKRLTGSTLSSSSMLSGTRADILKECDADEVLRLLSKHKFNTKKAISAVRDNPNHISTGWSATEREIFDDGYRKHHGALRMVAKALAPTKSMKQVVDYYYRFKIPDQYRLYQNKKREQAIQLIECIEKRRNPSAPIAGAEPSTINVTESEDLEDENPNVQPTGPWQETTVEDTVHALEDRRQVAKKLLLDIDAMMGSDTLTKIAVGIERLHANYDRETKDELLRELRNEPDLQRRLLELLPRDIY